MPLVRTAKAVPQDDAVLPDEANDALPADDVDVEKAVAAFAEGFANARTWWSENSVEVHPTNWGPEIYGWAARTETALSQATGKVVRRWNVRPQPKVVRVGARLLARAGAVEAAEAPPRPRRTVVAEGGAEPPTAEQVDQALKMIRAWWELAESHGRAARRIAGLGDADIQSR